MSGGYFDYQQYRINDIVDELEQVLEDAAHGKSPDYLQYEDFNTYEQFAIGWKFLKMAEIYANRIDWLLSGDDGEDSFHRRLKNDMEVYAVEEEKIKELLDNINKRKKNEDKLDN